MSTVNRTEQNQLQLKANELQRDWEKQAKRTLMLQNRMVILKGELKSSKVEHNKTFKSFQKTQKKASLEKHKNDMAHFKEKAKERRLSKNKKQQIKK